MTIGDRAVPVDQCSADPGFSQFRQHIAAAVARRDVRAITDALHPEVLVDLGGGQGRETFAASWSLASPDDSPLWDALRQALSLGCAMTGNGVRVIPAMSEQLDPELDLYDVAVAVRPGLALRRERREDSDVLARLDWDVVEVLGWPDSGDHVKVRLKDGRTGFVLRDGLRSPLERRLTVEQVDGKWRITSFVEGD